MIKKNKKVSLAKKPFLVLSRRAIAGWLAVFFFVCGWMFAIGVLVGRGTAPIKFDISELQQKLKIAREDSRQKEQGSPLEQPESIKDKTDLDFYEALRDGSDDAKITVKPTEPVLNKKEAPPPAPPPEDKPSRPIKESLKKKTISRNKVKSGVELPANTSAKPAEPSKNDPESAAKPVGKPYAIQVAAFREAADADRLVAELKQLGFSAYRAIGKVPGKGIWYRVRVGEYISKADAGAELSRLKDAVARLKKDYLKPNVVDK
jgi:cell division protein FtsN